MRVPKPRKTWSNLKKYCFPSTIAIWNSLPNSIHVIDSVNEFMHKTKEYIWTNTTRTHNLEPD